MQIRYIDNYDEELLEIDSPYMPRVGDSVHIGDIDEWIVTKVTWVADLNIGLVQLTLSEEMPIVREGKKADNSGRLDEMQNAILAVQNEQTVLRKKNRSVRDQVSNIRSNINQQNHKDRKQT